MRQPGEPSARSTARLAIAVATLAAIGFSRPGSAAGVPDANAVVAPGHRIEVPAWAYPQPPPTGEAQAQADPSLLQVPGSRATFTRAQVTDPFSPPDWHPESHPAMPEIVAHGRPPAVLACAYCHLPDGAGRPENASLAGLPAGYIIEQVAAFRSGARRSAWTGANRPTDLMRASAEHADAEEITAAAAYFSRLRLAPRFRVVEATHVPVTTVAGWLYVPLAGAGTEPIGLRIIEVAEDQERHELRDPAVGYIAYVPEGSIDRGRKIAAGAGPAPACATCHGIYLRGVGLIPPIAGRSPTYILRQLLAFSTGTRATAAGAAMAPVVADMGLDDMVAVAAYVASRGP
jgi:cytochrome c553